MATGKLLDVEPLELKFLFKSRGHSSCSLKLSNKTDDYVAFKVLTTNVNNYSVRPNVGIVLPQSTCDVIVTTKGQNEVPHDVISKDKFKILCVKTNDGTTKEDITREMFNKKKSEHLVEESRLTVLHVFSPRLLEIQPLELKFPFNMERQSSCSFQLSNKSDDYIAFKVMSTNVKNYVVRPTRGIVLPHSTFDIIVTIYWQKQFSLNGKDKLKVMSVKAKDGVTKDDITSEMFHESLEYDVEECRLRTLHVFPSLPSQHQKKVKKPANMGRWKHGIVNSKEDLAGIIVGSSGREDLIIRGFSHKDLIGTFASYVTEEDEEGDSGRGEDPIGIFASSVAESSVRDPEEDFIGLFASPALTNTPETWEGEDSEEEDFIGASASFAWKDLTESEEGDEEDEDEEEEEEKQEEEAIRAFIRSSLQNLMERRGDDE